MSSTGSAKDRYDVRLADVPLAHRGLVGTGGAGQVVGLAEERVQAWQTPSRIS
jgi:hypothetical protein